jgi:hypothetical protein
MINLKINTSQSKKFISLNSSDSLTLIGGLFVVVLILIPYMTNGFWFDDALNSQVYFGLQRVHGDLVDFSFRVVKHWLYHEGRLMFGFLYGYPLFYFFNDLFALRLANSIAVIINISLFGYVFWVLGASVRFLVVWAILLVGLFQISGAGLDPVAGFAFHYPILGIQLAIVLLLFIKWILYKKDIYLFCALIFWLFSMLTYEINIIFIPIALIITFLNGDQYRKFPGFLLISAALFYLALNFYFRTLPTGGGYPGTRFGLLTNIGLTYLKQLTASLPFISYLAITHNSFPISSIFKEAVSSSLAWVVFIISSIIFISFTKTKSSVGILRKEAFVISLGMFLLPAIFPAISLRYQNEVGWGAGTLPVYYQNFGFAFFGACAMSFFPRVGVYRFVIPFIIGAYLVLNLTINLSMVKIIDKIWREPRDAFALQAQSGLFSKVKDGDIIRVKNVSHYINSNLIFQWTGKRVFVPTDDHYWFPEAPRKFANVFDLSRSGSDRSYQLIPVVYNATLAEGIQFAAKPYYPSFIKSVEGMSGYEAIGRWTEGKNVIFTFTQKLPTIYTLELELAGAFGPNAGKEIQIQSGVWQGRFIVDVKPRMYKIPVKTNNPTDKIEFIIPEPKSPNELGGSGDPRQLGIMFKRLSIITN